MDTIREGRALIAAAARLGVERFPAIAAPLLLGWVGREVGILASVLFSSHLILSTLAFTTAMVAWVVGLVLALRAALTRRSTYVVDPESLEILVQPTGTDISARRILVEAVVPFLAAYSAWGMVEEHLQRVFNTNMIHYGVDSARYSITFAQWQLYLAVAAVAWVVQAVVELTLRDRGGLLMGVARAFIRGTVILTAFVGVGTLLTFIEEWFYTRQLWAWIRTAWLGFLEWLPEWQLWWGMTVPEAVREVVRGLWDDVVPGLWTMILMPLVWLALTASIVGWRHVGDALAPGRLTSHLVRGRERLRATRAGRAVEEASGAGPLRMLRAWIDSQVEDLVPVVQALRLVARSGWPFLAAFVVLASAARAVEPVLEKTFFYLAEIFDLSAVTMVAPTVGLVAQMLSWMIQIPFYAVAFERAMERADLLRAQSVTQEEQAPAPHRSGGSEATPSPR